MSFGNISWKVFAIYHMIKHAAGGNGQTLVASWWATGAGLRTQSTLMRRTASLSVLAPRRPFGEHNRIRHFSFFFTIWKLNSSWLFLSNAAMINLFSGTAHLVAITWGTFADWAKTRGQLKRETTPSTWGAGFLKSYLLKKLINKASHEQVNSKAGQKIKRVIYCEPSATKKWGNSFSWASASAVAA